MSWKSIVITGLLCVLASPALADPTATGKALGLDVNGNWVWSFTTTPDATKFVNSGPTGTPPNTNGGSIALEVAITASGRNLVSAAANTTNFPNNNPATVVPGFAFWTAADSGVKTNVASNQLVAGLGSTFFSSATAQEAFRVHTAGPTTAALTTTLTLSGAYTSKGRVAQAGVNYDSITGALNQAVKAGNANLSPNVDVGDLAILAANFGGTGKHWQQADFTGEGSTNVGDLAVLAANFGQADPNWVVGGSVTLPATPGAGGGSLAVPEPTSFVMLCLAGFGATLWRRRSC